VIYADANVIIRLIEGDAVTRAPLEARLSPLKGTAGFLHTSRLSWLECRIKPLRAKDYMLLGLYDAFFTSAELTIVELSRSVVEKATDVRADLNVKTPDALHLASAIRSGVKTFLTGDKGLARCKEVAVEVL
jgi:predicted nucleic acid-binding protein